jgi:tetratricopeptide (TPR) repeat protein
MKALSQYIKDNPDEASAWFLRGYHYKYLGYDKDAQKQLTRALELESRDRLAADLLIMAGGELPPRAEPATPTPSDILPAAPSDDASGAAADARQAPSSDGK